MKVDVETGVFVDETAVEVRVTDDVAVRVRVGTEVKVDVGTVVRVNVAVLAGTVAVGVNVAAGLPAGSNTRSVTEYGGKP